MYVYFIDQDFLLPILPLFFAGRLILVVTMYAQMLSGLVQSIQLPLI